MANRETKRKEVSGRAALVGGLIIATLSFSAGVVGARSHKPIERSNEAAIVRMETRAGLEPRVIQPADQGITERRVPGHSECDLQLD